MSFSHIFIILTLLKTKYTNHNLVFITARQYSYSYNCTVPSHICNIIINNHKHAQPDKNIQHNSTELEYSKAKNWKKSWLHSLKVKPMAATLFSEELQAGNPSKIMYGRIPTKEELSLYTYGPNTGTEAPAPPTPPPTLIYFLRSGLYVGVVVISTLLPVNLVFTLVAFCFEVNFMIEM